MSDFGTSTGAAVLGGPYAKSSQSTVYGGLTPVAYGGPGAKEADKYLGNFGGEPQNGLEISMGGPGV